MKILKLLITVLVLGVLLISCAPSNAPVVNTEYILTTDMRDGNFVYVGVSDGIGGSVNPALQAKPGEKISVTLINSGYGQHDIVFPELNVKSETLTQKGETTSVTFTVPDKNVALKYQDSTHARLGMSGVLLVGDATMTQTTSANPAKVSTNAGNASDTGSNANVSSDSGSAETVSASTGPADEAAVDITRDPTDIPAPIGNRGPQNVRVDLETTELPGQLADGTTYSYWTFNGKVPGPLIRVRVGDTVELHLKNSPDSLMTHSIDLHAVTGPGGGSVATQTQPGGESVVTFKTLKPGLFVYHCATPMVAQHISNGMYGMILVEPAGGLPPVDREFYVMQGELYTVQPFGTTGALNGDTIKLLNETPEYFVFNGASMALTSDAHALRANVGETVRIFFGVGGPNYTSAFHIIGEAFDKVYDLGSLSTPPMVDVQTTLVPPGGATMVELKLEVPGRYILVDHALSRLQRGLAGYLYAEGDPNPDVFNAETPNSSQ
ncbi:MAG: copper-containing nitrite reductase [Anaerolineales bacterium]